MDRPLVSFLLPSRTQPGKAHTPATLLTSLESITANSTNTNVYEVLIRFDEDDIQSIDLIPTIHEIFAPTVAQVKIIVGPRRGYEGLHRYYNELAAIATGELLFLWNDDLEICPVRSPWTTPNGGHHLEAWDATLKEDLGDRGPYIFMLFPTEVYSDHISMLSFPILTRRAYEAMGHFSHSPLNDAYLLNVGCLDLDGENIRKRSRLIVRHNVEVDEVGVKWREEDHHFPLALQIHRTAEMTALELKDQEAIRAIYASGE